MSHSIDRPIRVLLVDDHAVVRKGLRALLEHESGVEVIGEADNGEQAEHAAVLAQNRLACREGAFFDLA